MQQGRRQGCTDGQILKLMLDGPFLCAKAKYYAKRYRKKRSKHHLVCFRQQKRYRMRGYPEERNGFNERKSYKCAPIDAAYYRFYTDLLLDFYHIKNTVGALMYGHKGGAECQVHCCARKKRLEEFAAASDNYVFFDKRANTA